MNHESQDVLSVTHAENPDILAHYTETRNRVVREELGRFAERRGYSSVSDFEEQDPYAGAWTRFFLESQFSRINPEELWASFQKAECLKKEMRELCETG